MHRTASRAVDGVDVEGYFACVERCRGLFPDLRVITGIEVGEPAPGRGFRRVRCARAHRLRHPLLAGRAARAVRAQGLRDGAAARAARAGRTFGSDAHLPSGLAFEFRAAVDLVEAHGFRPGRHPYDTWIA